MGCAGGVVRPRRAQQRLDRAHHFLTGVKTLAVVQKLLKPALAPVEIASRLGGERPPGHRFARLPYPLTKMPLLKPGSKAKKLSSGSISGPENVRT